MTFTPMQVDALIEIGNVGMSKAAKQLSILLSSPINITIPELSFMTIDEIAEQRIFDGGQIYSFVSQTLSADLEGCAALLFRREHANLLITSVMGAMPEFTPEEARACEQEAMLEIGNIIITSCLSVIANMLSQTICLSLPVYNEDNILPLLRAVCAPMVKRSKQFIVITTRLDTCSEQLSGYLFIILTETSGSVLLNAIKKLIGE